MPDDDEIQELKAYVEGVLHGKVVMEQMGYCKLCGKYEDLRFGVCFYCVFPKCPLGSCTFKKLVHDGYGTPLRWKNMQYTGLKGIIYCDRLEGLCAKAKLKLQIDT